MADQGGELNAQEQQSPPLPAPPPVSFMDMNVAKGQPANARIYLSSMYGFAEGVPTSGRISFASLRAHVAGRANKIYNMSLVLINLCLEEMKAIKAAGQEIDVKQYMKLYTLNSLKKYLSSKVYVDKLSIKIATSMLGNDRGAMSSKSDVMNAMCSMLYEEFSNVREEFGVGAGLAYAEARSLWYASERVATPARTTPARTTPARTTPARTSSAAPSTTGVSVSEARYMPVLQANVVDRAAVPRTPSAAMAGRAFPATTMVSPVKPRRADAKELEESMEDKVERLTRELAQMKAVSRQGRHTQVTCESDEDAPMQDAISEDDEEVRSVVRGASRPAAVKPAAVKPAAVKPAAVKPAAVTPAAVARSVSDTYESVFSILSAAPKWPKTKATIDRVDWEDDAAAVQQLAAWTNKDVLMEAAEYMNISCSSDNTKPQIVQMIWELTGPAMMLNHAN